MASKPRRVAQGLALSILQALRATDLTSSQVMERFGKQGATRLREMEECGWVSIRPDVPSSYEALRVKKHRKAKGLQTRDCSSYVYSITPAGAADCPPRNPALLTVRRLAPVVGGPNVNGPTTQAPARVRIFPQFEGH